MSLRIAEEARRLQARARLDRALLGLNRADLANADSQRLADALAVEQPDASPDERLAAAQADRNLAARLIGQQPIKPRWRSPMRLSDGRAGYPLSGRFRFSNLLRSGRDAIHTHLQSLYPGLNREQIRTLARDMARHGDVAGQIRVLGEQRTTLAETLQNWTDTGTEDEYDNRRRLSRLLNRTWSREGGQHLHLDYLVLDTLPSLPVPFPHITELSMDSVHLQTIPEDFLQSFPNLQRLSWPITRNWTHAPCSGHCAARQGYERWPLTAHRSSNWMQRPARYWAPCDTCTRCTSPMPV